MKVGITCNIQYSIFGSSRGQNAFWIGQVFKGLGWDVCLVNQSERVWWEDAEGLEGEFPVVHFKDMSGGGLDLLVDIDGIVSPVLRRAWAKKTVVLIRGSIAFGEIEQCSYIDDKFYRNLEGVSAIWVWDLLNSEEDIRPFKTMFPCPVLRVPFIWSPIFLKNYIRLVGYDMEWMKECSNYRLHICEKNRGNANNCIIPLAVAKEVEHQEWIDGKIDKKYILHNYDSIMNKPYFEENIIKAMDFKGEIIKEGRGRIVDLMCNEGDGFVPIVITHNRFSPITYLMVELAWLGIPFVHNSDILLKMEHELQGRWYMGNYTESAMYTVRECMHDLGYYIDCSEERRASIEREWSIEGRLDEWKKAIDESEMKSISVYFYGMWDGFNMEDNFFIREMRRRYPNVCVALDDKKADLIIFSRFCGDEWKVMGRKGVGKVFYSGECPYDDYVEYDDADLLLTHMPDNKKRRNIRMPIWLQYLDFDSNDIRFRPGLNPNGISMRYACTSHLKKFEEREGFCSYIVSNPQNEIRNKAFHLASEYKKIDSAGELFNNIGGIVENLYAGGGGGDVQKHLFLENYKFNICYENEICKGYVTEKLLQAKMAGCVPIYWGDETALQDFNPEGFIYIREPEKIGEILKELDEGGEKASKIASTPAFDMDRIKKVYKMRDKIADRLIEMGLNGVGVREDEDVIEGDSMEVSVPVPDPVFVSFANMKYLQYLIVNIESIGRQRGELTSIRYIVYLDDDITEDEEEKLKKRFSWVETRRLRKDTVDEFPDFWDIRTFGWKLVILEELSRDESLTGSLIVYTDSGAQWIRLPEELLHKGWKEGVCLVEDSEQINRYWCSPEMVAAMAVTEEELAGQQLMAGFIVFKGRSKEAMRLFSEALMWGKKREVLHGEFVREVLENGQNIGHRHDQSILSILSMRMGLSRVNGYGMICSSTLRKAFLEGAAIYLHRGNYITHEKVLEGIDDMWVISLDRRADRWKQWCDENPVLASIANRFSAIDGKQIKMNDDLYTLFANNDFLWKKSVAGCALSHIMLWAQLACEKPPVGTYLILEDDMRFANKEWMGVFEKAMKCVPADAELLYLGGVLPKNMGLYRECMKPVNEYWGAILPNPYFNGEGKMLPIFHFCAYSYILTKAGARKLLNALNTVEGCCTSIDHVLGMFPKKYALRDLMTKCFQEEEQIYIDAEFDNFKRVDNYDSDIWNNVDVWNANELADFKIKKRSVWFSLDSIAKGHPVHSMTRNLLGANSYLEYLHRTGQKDEMEHILRELSSNKEKRVEKKNNDVKEQVVRKETVKQIPIKNVIHDNAMNNKIIYYYNHDTGRKSEFMETEWLREIIGPNTEFRQLESQHKIVEGVPIFLVTVPYIGIWKRICKKYDDIGRDFYIIHLSDENCRDDIEMYDYKHCKGVIRNYTREGLNSKVTVIPLGYMRNCKRAGDNGNLNAGAKFSEREQAWMFHGTGWFGRGEILHILQNEFENNDCKIMKQWLDENMTSEEVYKTSLYKTKFCPILRGNNIETYRLYEAIETGVIPIYVRINGDDLFWKMIHEKLGLIELNSWDDAVECMRELIAYPDEAEKYRLGIWSRWMRWKQEISREISKMI